MNDKGQIINVDFEGDPVQQLEETKDAIKKQIAAEKLNLKQANKTLTRIERLSVEVVVDKVERVAEQLEIIKQHTESLIELELDLKSLTRTRDDETEEKIQGALNRVYEEIILKDESCAYIIESGKFISINEFSRVIEGQNVVLSEMEATKYVEHLSKTLGIKAWHLPVPRVKDLFNMSTRTFDLKRWSVVPTRWREDLVYLPMIKMRPYFINNFVLTNEQQQEADKSIKFFDALMYSLSGGKQENVNHIEQWILHKIINFDKVATTPELVIVGHVGGNGKGIIQAIVRLLLPAALSGKANVKTLTGGFNAILLGKLIVFFDDQDSKELSLDVVKELAGNDTMVVEEKGNDQYEGEKTYSSAWFSNKLPFRLTPGGQEGGVDRRFSVMRTSITFLESLRKLVKEESDYEISIEEAKDLAETVVRDKLLNRINIAGWFKYLQAKHPHVDRDFVLKSLHGEDYHYFLNRQITPLEVIFKDLCLPLLRKGKVVPFFIIKELIRHSDSSRFGDKRIKDQLRNLAAESKVEIEDRRVAVTIKCKDDYQKQCLLIVPADFKGKVDYSFDWSLVSKQDYMKSGDLSKLGQEELIPEDYLAFGVGTSNPDDDDGLFGFTENL